MCWYFFLEKDDVTTHPPLFFSLYSQWYQMNLLQPFVDMEHDKDQRIGPFSIANLPDPCSHSCTSPSLAWNASSWPWQDLGDQSYFRFESNSKVPCPLQDTFSYKSCGVNPSSRNLENLGEKLFFLSNPFCLFFPVWQDVLLYLDGFFLYNIFNVYGVHLLDYWIIFVWSLSGTTGLFPCLLLKIDIILF